MLLGSGRGDLILDRNFLPRIVFIFLLYSATPYISEEQARAVLQKGGESGGTNLESEGSRLCSFGEIFACALLVVCVELERCHILANAIAT